MHKKWMFQAGILAAAGIVALETMPKRLFEDHQRAKRLAEGLSKLPNIRFEMGMPQTNMVFPTLSVESPKTVKQIAAELFDRGIRVGVVGDSMLRLVTHYWITDEDVDTVLASFTKLLID